MTSTFDPRIIGPAISGDTATGREILAKDWSPTSLGHVDRWSVSLRTTLAMMLACPTPMFLAWGPELLLLYNDAYRPILGDRLDGALGARFHQVWSDVWPDVSDIVEDALAGRGRAVRDLPLAMMRHGHQEATWWTFSYSPVWGDEGDIAGMLCITSETTDRVLTDRAKAVADERLQLALGAGHSIGAWDWDVVADRLYSDARFATLYGVDPEAAAVGAPLASYFEGIHPDDRDATRAAIDHSVATGETFAAEYRLVGAEGAVRWVSAQGRCVLDEQGRCVRFPGVSFDVTDRKLADIRLRVAKEEREFVIALVSRQRSLSDPEAVMRMSSEALARRLGVNRACFYRQLGESRVRYGPGWSDGMLSPLGGELSSFAFGDVSEKRRRDGKLLSFSDSRFDRDGGLTDFSQGGVLSGVDVPLMSGGIYGSGFLVHHGEVRKWSSEEILLVKEVAELTWLAVERVEALLRLEDRVGRQGEQLVQAASDLRSQTDGRASAETQVRQLQKMEAVGQLTGGIAHDFNNMLAIVIGGLNLTQRKIARGDADVGKYLDGAMEGATRAAALTQRLLAFSRQQPLSPEAIDCNRLVADLTDLLTRTLGDQVRLETVLSAGLWKARADPNQLENVIVNLAVNARDAMPDGGMLTIETGNAHVDDDYASEAEIEPGQYLMLAVSDTGTGMTKEVIAKAFDPFFTTKGVGRGTGLGLSQVFGFVRQSGGHVRIYSELGVGTTFKIYLPRFYGDAPPVQRRRSPGDIRGGEPHEIVMVVEDEDRVRNFNVEALRELGYTVVHAASGPDALAMIDAGQDVTLLFTDIVMPEMTGRQLGDIAKTKLVDLRIVYTTGYTRNAVVHNGVLDAGTNFLAKPFGLDELASKIRDVLDAPV